MEIDKETETKKARTQRTVTLLKVSALLSTVQHCITLQAEPAIVRDLNGGDMVKTIQSLANMQGLVGVLSVFVNQVGGKLSDTLGRKLGMLLGPMSNVFIGYLVWQNPTNKPLVFACKVLKWILTTFSNTVMTTAALADTVSGKDFAVALSQLSAWIGIAVVVGPILEGQILKRNKFQPNSAFGALAVIGSIHLGFHMLLTSETLDKSKRAALNLKAAINPFGFMNIFTKGSSALQKMVSATTLQMALEGKNLSDMTLSLWMKERLKLSVDFVSNYVAVYGTLCTLAGWYITPYILKNGSPRSFTTLTNATNLTAFLMRSKESLLMYLLAIMPMLPGVNGNAGLALKSLATDKATKEGFGKGEFSAWLNNLRALMGAAAPMLYGYTYAWSQRKGYPPGTFFWMAALFGAFLPEILQRRISTEEVPEICPP